MALKTVAKLNKSGEIYEIQVEEQTIRGAFVMSPYLYLKDVNFEFDENGHQLKKATVSFGKVGGE